MKYLLIILGTSDEDDEKLNTEDYDPSLHLIIVTIIGMFEEVLSS
jgi:hypothetical protein